MAEPTTSQLDPTNETENCQVCGQKAHGNHFGAVACRACAAFFRRSIISKKTRYCKKKKECVLLNNGFFSCKRCRLKKCRDVGMTERNIQLDREPFGSSGKLSCPQFGSFPQTMDTFIGRSNLIIFLTPQNGSDQAKNFVDMRFLVEKATRILIEGAETPLFTENKLKKLAIGHELIRGRNRKSVKKMTKLGRKEIFRSWEREITSVAKWLTYFDDYKMLSQDLQVEVMKSIWRVWTRLETLVGMAMCKRQNVCGEENILLWNTSRINFPGDIDQLDVDVSWCSRYSLDQLKMFNTRNREKRVETLIESMLCLEPTEEELSYMMIQLCFHYAAKRFGGEVAQVLETFQDSIANDLHEYYVKELGTPYYSGRVMKMMKINNQIQESIYLDRERSDVVEVLDVFCVEFSHPEMFLDY